MKNAILTGLTRLALRSAVFITIFLAAGLMAQPLVKTMGGGTTTGSFGFKNTNTLFSLFHTPMGLAISQDGQTVFVADRDNNAVRLLTDFGSPNNGWTFTFTTNFLSKPVGVAVDSGGNVYVLNRGTTNAVATNGTVLEFDQYGFFVQTNAYGLTNASSMVLDPLGDIYVTERSNLLVEITNGTTTVGTVAAVNLGTNVSLQGIALMPGGQIAACDSGRNGIYIITPASNPANALITTNSGFNGPGDGTGINNRGLPVSHAQFLQPMGVAAASDGTLIVSDFGNGHVKVITTAGVVTNFYGVVSNDWTTSFKGWVDGQVVVPDLPGGVAGRCPVGVILSADGSTVYTTEDFYHLVRRATGQGFAAPIQPIPAVPTGLTATLVTNGNSTEVVLAWNSVNNATQYVVRRNTSGSPPYTILTTTAATSFTDANVTPGNGYYYVVQSLNSGGASPNSAPVGPINIPVPPPLAPQIGWFDFEGNVLTGFFSVLHPVSPGNPYIANNPLNLAIDPIDTNGPQTYYITIPPLTNNMTAIYVITNGSAPPVFHNNQLFGSLLVNALPSLPTANGLVTIEAVNTNAVGGASAVTSASFLFQVAPITLNGTNAAQFSLSDLTTNLTYVYTVDGSDPLTSPTAQQLITISNTTPFSINISTNFLFTVVGESGGFANSPVLKYTFLGQNFQATTLTWGFASGYCSSKFIASPGENFYAPVTLTTLPNTAMYGLEFNMTVTNLGSDVVPSGGFGFQSMLLEPASSSNVVGIVFEAIPPMMFANNAINPPPANQLVQFNGTNFVNLEVPNTNLNELAVGWFEIFQHTNLFNTLAQNLLTFSEAFVEQIPDQQFPNKDIVGGYFFQVPTNATPGEQYQIQLNRASANGDGLDGPNSAVPMVLPVTGSLTNGTVNAIKIVTVGQPKYLVGDIYPFYWFNAGDFGYGSLTNYAANDVVGTFDAAVYDFNVPPVGSDFYDAMDSAGRIGTYNAAAGYWVPSGTLSGVALNPLFDVNDATTINTMAFGDGTIDICDVFTTFARSQFANVYWFQRFYTNDPVHGVFGRVALAIFPQTNVIGNGALFQPIKPPGGKGADTNQAVSITNTPVVHFLAGDYLASAGQTISIPITVTVFGPDALRMMMLNVTVVPLDGSPAPTAAPTLTLNAPFNNANLFNPPGAFGLQDNSHGNYAAAFLPKSFPISTNVDVRGSNVVGYLNVTIPANATSSSAYALHFNHASASPNGLVSFPKTTYTGLITLSSRTNSNYGDGIPDSWRLRYFGTINNQLSAASADADGTGMNNYQKYVAGLNPVDPTSVLNEGTDQPMAQSAQDHVIYWPSVNGKTYIIQRSPTLFPGQWTAISTNAGTGSYMEIHDAPAGANYYYRVSTQ